MKRAAPEELEGDAGPLFALARERAELGALRAASRAENVAPGWRAAALEQVRAFAATHERFTAEEIGLSIPADADPRAAGHVMQEARRRGIVEPDGYAPTLASHGSAKVRWRSRVFGGSA